ncbi:hypothetical protein SS50377_28193 [Spironucleus salmonicida]|uniref:Uncharacterized protein n=1 Tax=Spironucleus salmonicida TaxID=348837 RepID=V6LZT5_9EUKA|nr:hypothetical protein SS50377_28193 [Spironucleus salmonicida]|eukprot:EST46364.1 Hypothetical protein SS50377_13607 [Spironucleus salmonicida]
MLAVVLQGANIFVTSLPHTVDFPSYGIKIYYGLSCELASNNNIFANITLDVDETASLQIFYGCTDVSRLIITAYLNNPSYNQSFSSVFGVVDQPLQISHSTFVVTSFAKYASGVVSYAIAPCNISLSFIYFTTQDSMSASSVINWIHGAKAIANLTDLVVDAKIIASLFGAGLVVCIEEQAAVNMTTVTLSADIYTRGVSAGAVGTIRTEGKSIIKNVIVTGKISALRDEFVSGLIGQAKVGTVSQTIYCVVYAEVKGWCKGGISGQNYQNNAELGRLVINLDNGTKCLCPKGFCKRLVDN